MFVSFIIFLYGWFVSAGDSGLVMFSMFPLWYLISLVKGNFHNLALKSILVWSILCIFLIVGEGLNMAANFGIIVFGTELGLLRGQCRPVWAFCNSSEWFFPLNGDLIQFWVVQFTNFRVGRNRLFPNELNLPLLGVWLHYRQFLNLVLLRPSITKLFFLEFV